jgi:hypothetical protein
VVGCPGAIVTVAETLNSFGLNKLIAEIAANPYVKVLQRR